MYKTNQNFIEKWKYEFELITMLVVLTKFLFQAIKISFILWVWRNSSSHIDSFEYKIKKNKLKVYSTGEMQVWIDYNAGCFD